MKDHDGSEAHPEVDLSEIALRSKTLYVFLPTDTKAIGSLVSKIVLMPVLAAGLRSALDDMRFQAQAARLGALPSVKAD